MTFPTDTSPGGVWTLAWARRIKASGRKRHPAEEMINRLRQADMEFDKGNKVAGVCKLLESSNFLENQPSSGVFRPSDACV